MKASTAKLLVDASNDIDGNDGELRLYCDGVDNYCSNGFSRSMTTAVIFDRLPSLFAAIAFASSVLARNGGDFDGFCEDLKSLRTDSLGRQSVLY